MYMLTLNFTYPLRCLRVPPGVRVPPVEYHCNRRPMLLTYKRIRKTDNCIPEVLQSKVRFFYDCFFLSSSIINSAYSFCNIYVAAIMFATKIGLGSVKCENTSNDWILVTEYTVVPYLKSLRKCRFWSLVVSRLALWSHHERWSVC
jgi:hypothetical protein